MNKQQGMSIVAVLVGLTLAGVLVMILAKTFSFQMRANRALEESAALNALRQKVLTSLDCTQTVGPPGGDAQCTNDDGTSTQYILRDRAGGNLFPGDRWGQSKVFVHSTCQLTESTVGLTIYVRKGEWTDREFKLKKNLLTSKTRDWYPLFNADDAGNDLCSSSFPPVAGSLSAGDGTTVGAGAEITETFYIRSGRKYCHIGAGLTDAIRWGHDHCVEHEERPSNLCGCYEGTTRQAFDLCEVDRRDYGGGIENHQPDHCGMEQKASGAWRLLSRSYDRGHEQWLTCVFKCRKSVSL